MTKGVYTTLDELRLYEHKASGFSFLPRQPVHSVLTGRRRSRIRGRGLDFEELRTYQPGDDVRTIDWRVTSRTRKPHVRVFTEERERPVLVLVDQRSSMFFGSKRAMKSVVAAECAAMAAWRVLSVGDRLGGIVFGDEELTEVRPHRSRKRVLQLLKEIVEYNRRLIKPTVDSAQMLNKVLRRTINLAKHDYLICLITDTRGANEETGQLLTTLSRHNDVLIGYVFDPLERELPAENQLVFSGDGGQILVDGTESQLRAAYSVAFEKRLDEARKFLLKRTIPLVPICTDKDVSKQIRAALGHRPGRTPAVKVRGKR